jgi:hypothetical protein
MAIFYYHPPSRLRSAGLRVLVKHVALLEQAGLDAFLLTAPRFTPVGLPETTPIVHIDKLADVDENDVVVIPEGHPKTMALFSGLPWRRFVFALSWSYVFTRLNDGQDWRDFGIERVLAESNVAADFINWSMGLPVHVVRFAIDPALYHVGPEPKEPLVCCIRRKADCIAPLKRALAARNPALVNDIRWVAMHDLPEPEYASMLRRASVFVALSTEEAAHLSVYEAMACGALVAGFSGIGLSDVMRSSGEGANCLRVENGDYPRLARELEPLLSDLLAGDTSRWQHLVDGGIQTAAEHTKERERKSVVELWRELIGSRRPLSGK